VLLKAKRISYGHGATICIPDNSLLDKPIGDKIFTADMIALYGESTRQLENRNPSGLSTTSSQHDSRNAVPVIRIRNFF
jgi:hypothetical protein